MKSKKCILSILLCIVLVAVLVFSSVFIITHAHHDCTGIDCSVCAKIHVAQQVLNSLKAVLTACAIFAGLYFICYKAVVFEKHNNVYFMTLVDLKVKLSN